MISLYDSTGKIRQGVTFQSLNLNSVTPSAAGGQTTRVGYSVETVGFRTAFDYTTEPNQWDDMNEIFGLRKISRMVVLKGVIYGSSRPDLFDKIKALAYATDASRIKFQNPNTWQEQELTFRTLTTDTGNFASGYVPSKYLVVPIRMGEPVIIGGSKGHDAQFEVDFLLREPKRFYQTQTSQSGAGTISNSLADDRSWPTLTITSSGAGSATFSITNTSTYQGAKTLTLNLSTAVNGDVWTVNFRDRIVLKNGTKTPSVYVVGSDWFAIEPGNNAITYANTTNTSSRVLTFYPAWTL